MAAFGVSCLLVQFGNPITQAGGFFLFNFRFLLFLLAHQGADFFGGAIALCFKILDLTQSFSALVIEPEYFVDMSFVTGPA